MASPESRQIRASFVTDPDAPELPPAVMREQWEAAAAAVVLPSSISIRPVELKGRAGTWVDGPTFSPRHVLLYLHGGGYNSGSSVTHRELAARLSLASGARVLLCDYRLAPEHPFPAAVEDAAAAYRWLLEQGFNPQQLAIGGDSSGGGLAVATLLQLREEAVALPAAAVLLSPWVDLALTGESLQTRAAVDPLTSRRGLQRAATWYLGQAAATNPLASPLYAELHSLPPLLIQVGDHEVLLSDATRLAEKARAAGVEVALEVWEEMWHVWQAFAGTLPEGRQAIEQIGRFIRQHLASIDAA